MSADRSAIRVHLLGGFSVLRDGTRVRQSDWQRRGAAPLIVKFLATEPTHQLHREQILDRLWPGDDSQSALNSFGKALHAARRALEPSLRPRAESRFIRFAGDLLVLDPNQVWVDLDYFEALASRALTDSTVANLEAALEAYGGELLPEDRYADWTVRRREALVALHLQLLTVLGNRLAEQGEVGRAEYVWRQALEREPALEEVHRGLMMLAAVRGNRSEALRRYAVAKETLQRELGIAPDRETEKLYEQIVSSELLVPRRAVPTPGAGASVPPTDSSQQALPAAIRQLPPHPLVGRDGTLAGLQHDLAAVLRGTGRVIMLSGEAGVGKSRLVADLARQVAARDGIVLWGTSYGDEHIAPYRPFVEALESYLVVRPAVERADYARRYPELALVVPSLASAADPTSANPDNQLGFGQLDAQFAGILSDLASERAVMVVLDDLQGADSASLYLLQHLGRAASDHRWMLAGTYREDATQPGSDLYRVVRWLRREDIFRRIQLERLAPDDAVNLVESLLEGGEVSLDAHERLYALSLGNPLFIQELVRAMRARGTLRVVNGTWELAPAETTVVPYRVADLVVDQLLALDSRSQQLLQVAAAIGMEVELPLLRAAVIETIPGIGDEDVLSALDRAVAAGMLQDRVERYAFSHPLVHAAIADSQPTHRSRHVHGAVAAALERHRPDDHAALAYHWQRSAEPERAIPHVEQLARHALKMYANSEAVSAFRELVALLEREGRDADAAFARQYLGWALMRIGRTKEALVTLERAAQSHESLGNANNYVTATLQLVHLHIHAGETGRAIGMLAALDRRGNEGVAPHSLALKALAHAELSWLTGEYEAQLQYADEALQILRDHPEHWDAERAAASARVWLGVGLVSLERVSEGIRTLEAELPLLTRLDEVLDLSRAHNRLAIAYADRGDFQREREHLQGALDAAMRLGDPARISFARYRLGRSGWLTGNWAEARQQMELGLELEQETGGTFATPYLVYGLALLSLAEGRFAGLPEQIVERTEPSVRDAPPRLRWAIGVLRAEWHLLSGDPLAVIEGILPLLTVRGLTEGQMAVLHALLARAHLAQGQSEAARQAMQEALRRAHVHPNRLAQLEVLLAHAEVLLALSDLAEAISAAEQALALAREMHHPYGVARALLALGRVLEAGGQESQARALLDEAEGSFKRLGARVPFFGTRRPTTVKCTGT